jgi:hypothetical protein
VQRFNDVTPLPAGVTCRPHAGSHPDQAFTRCTSRNSYARKTQTQPCHLGCTKPTIHCMACMQQYARCLLPSISPVRDSAVCAGMAVRLPPLLTSRHHLAHATSMTKSTLPFLMQFQSSSPTLELFNSSIHKHAHPHPVQGRTTRREWCENCCCHVAQRLCKSNNTLVTNDEHNYW